MASTPYQAYTGDLTASTNAQQNLGIAGINSGAGFASPYIQQAAGQATASSAPIGAGDIQRYMSPYTQSVVDATTAQLRNEFGQQSAQLQGNQIAQGALGGNATGVAKGILGGQQARQLASTTAGLYQQGYNQALNAAQRQQQTGIAGANAIANYGISGQNAALQGAGAQFGVGTQQQTVDQAALDRLYQQYAQAQAFPYQQAQWLAGMATGVGSNLGGVSSQSGTTTGPAPNTTGQWLGAGLSAASMFLSDREAKQDITRVGELDDGTAIYRYRYKGDPQWHIGPMAQEVDQDNVAMGPDGYRYMDLKGVTDDVVGRASGGGVQAPWGGIAGQGWIPSIGISAGRGAPSSAGSAPSLPSQGGGGGDPSQLAKGIVGLGGKLQGLDWGGAFTPGGGFSGDAWGGGSFLGGDAYGGSSSNPLPGLDPSDYGEGFADGGGVMSDADPVGIAGGEQFAQASPWQMRPTSNGQVQVINIRTGQVVYTGTHAGASNTAASMNARQRARGGGILGDPEIDYVGRRYMEPDTLPPGHDINPVGDPAWSEAAAGDSPMPGPANMLPPGASFEDRAAPTRAAIADGTFDPAGINSTEFKGQGITPMPRPRPEEAPVVASDDEDGGVPTGIAPRAPSRSGAPVMAFEDSAHYRALPDAVAQPQQRRGFGLGLLSPNEQVGMLSAGLGMLSSRSPFLGNVVGEGGIAGLRAYSAAEERDRQVAAEAAQLAREARKEAYGNWMGERKQAEAERHNRATEERTAADKLPPGMMLDDKGNLVNRPGYISAMEARTKAKSSGASMDDDTAEFLAHRVLAGDTKALVGLGRGAQGAENLSKINGIVARLAKEGTPVNDAARNILQNAAQQQGLIAAERTQANIMSKLSVYGRTAFNATQIALDLSKEVPRTNFQPVNKILNAARTKTGDPKIVALGQALMTLTNEYARAIGGGHGTVHDKEAAEKRLSEAQSHEQLAAVIEVMRKEILAEEKAMPAAREHIRDIYNPRKDKHGKSISEEHGGASPRGPVDGASGAPGFTPPPGALQRTYNGKIYYYHPETKQPYPGQ